MNRKIILLPLAAAALILGACTPSTPAEGSSSEVDEPTSSPVEEPTSSTTSSTTPAPTLTYLEDVIGLEKGATYTARAYYMGRSPLSYKGSSNTNYDSIFVADGERGYILYRTDVELLKDLNVENWVRGKTLLQWTGTVADYTPEGSTITIYESTVSAISVVESGNVEDPVIYELNAESPKLEVTMDNQSRMAKITGAKISSVATDSYGSYDIDFTLGTNEYKVNVDNRYTDIGETSIFPKLRVGDTLDFTTFTDVRETFAYVLDATHTPDTTPAIEISGPTSVAVGETITLTATTYNIAEPTVTWTSSDTTKATVEGGVVTGVAAGEVKITAAVGEVTAEYAVNVYVKPATIVETGKLGLWQAGRGEAVYYSGAMSGNFLATTTTYADAPDITVYEATDGVQLQVAAGELDHSGKYIGAIRTDSGYNNLVAQDDPYVWEYDTEHDAYVCTLNNSKYFIGTSGNYSTFSLNSVSDYDSRYVAHVVQEAIPEPASIEVSGDTSVTVGETIELTATLHAIEGTVTWSSSDNEIATVDANGLVTGQSAGTVTITAAIGEVSGSIEIEVLAAGLSSVTYTFADYTAGTQYAKNEEHKLDDNVTCTVNDGHFTTQIRLYDSSSHDSTAVFQSTKPIVGIKVRAGNKAATLIVSGSNDGTAYTTIENITTTSTYTDYTVTMPTDGSYTYIKFDADGEQIRLESVTFTFAAE